MQAMAADGLLESDCGLCLCDLLLSRVWHPEMRCDVSRCVICTNTGCIGRQLRPFACIV